MNLLVLQLFRSGSEAVLNVRTLQRLGEQLESGDSPWQGPHLFTKQRETQIRNHVRA
jgi:hypothetical protein